MNYFLMLVILGLLGGGYYEYSTLADRGEPDRQQLTDMSAKVEALEAENKKLDDDKAQLTKSMADAQAQIDTLTKQIQATQNGITNPSPAVQPSNAGATLPTAKLPPPPSNDLGNIATIDGKTFQNCRLLKVQKTGVVISNADGIIQISYALMAPQLQKRFGYDPRQTAALTEAQVEFLEEERRAATQTAGN